MISISSATNALRRRIAAAGTAWRSTQRALRPARLIATRDDAAGTNAAPAWRPAGADAPIVSITADPLGSAYIASITGVVDRGAGPRLAALLASVAPARALHLDVTGAEIRCPAGLRLLAEVIDQLEARRVRLHVVGLDPHRLATLERLP